MDLILPGILFAFAVAFLAVAARRLVSRRRRRSPKCLCPGAPLRALERLSLLWLVYRPRCGYDLSEQVSDRAGALACPECGHRVARRDELRACAHGLRPMTIAAMLLAAAGLLLRFPPVQGATVVALAPTRLLLRGESILGIGTPMEVREEVRRRAVADALSAAETREFIRLLIADLRDDTLAGNATTALKHLALLGPACEESLLAALDGADAQQRHLICEMLLSRRRTGPQPTALLRAAIEELRSDGRSWNASAAWSYLGECRNEASTYLVDALASDDEQQRALAKGLLRGADLAGPVLARLCRLSVEDLHSGEGRGHAGDAFRFLVRHAADAEEALAAGLGSADVRQRLLCAAALGCGGRNGTMASAVPILASHLADNRIRGDATVAARALAGFGRQVVPLLGPWRDSADGQQRETVEFLIRRLTTDESVASLRQDLPLASLTLRADDVLELDPQWLSMPYGE